MATRYSQIKIGNIFEAGNSKFRKVDDMYYEDIYTGFESAWDPFFDNTILVKGVEEKEEVTDNTTDKFIIDPQTRLVKPNPAYKDLTKNAENAFSIMWESAEFDCGPEDYDWMANVSIAAVSSMKFLIKEVGLKDDITSYPTVINLLIKAYKQTPTTKKAASKKVVKKAAKKVVKKAVQKSLNKKAIKPSPKKKGNPTNKRKK